MKIPKSQIEFDHMFATHDQCVHYIAKHRWENGFICPKCKKTESWQISKELIICKYCEYQQSITAGTMFHSAKKDLTIYFRAMWWIVAQKNGVSALGLQHILGLGSYKTAWFWLQKFRNLMVLNGRQKLEGTIQIDETFVGGKATGKRGRGAENKSLVAIAVEKIGKGSGRARLQLISDASSKSLNSFIKDNVTQGSVIITDGWKGYNYVERIGYKHVIEKATNIEGEEILPFVHRIASLLKRWLLGTHQNYTSESYLEFYLDEFIFRYNRRKSKSRGLLFCVLLEQALIHEPLQNEKINQNKEI